jgi:N-acetylglutamate synthase-like GNAT family acetyltransferase
MTSPTAFTIRRATAEDAALIKRTVQQARLDRTGLDWRNFKLAVDEQGQMVGICQVRRYVGTRELGSLYVRQAYRGQGVAAALIHACLAGQPAPVHLECVEARQAYYERFNFRRISPWQAPMGLRAKSLLGGTIAHLFFGQRIIVMRWDG